MSRLTAEGLAAQVAAVYADVEVRLLSMMARYLEQGTESPDWLNTKMAELQTFRRRAMRLIAAGEDEAVELLVGALHTAYMRGQASAQGELDTNPDLTDEAMPAPRFADLAIQSMVAAQSEQMRGLSLPIVRAAEGALRDIIVSVAAGSLTGATTRLQDAQTALDRLGSRGIRAVTDTAGRQWELQTYVEMATRTVTAQASVQGHLDRLEDAGINLFQVSDSPRECEICAPWEGKILSRGPVSAIQRNRRTGKMESVRVDGTVEEATRAGLFHPNCTHNLSGYIHGATRTSDAGNDRAGYEAQQRQRQMERKVREWKRREAVAVTPAAKARARAKVKAWRDAIDAHTKEHGLPRKRNRETLTAAR
ncbi:phage minor capsid protein [Nocardioides sp. YR527]|uniref:phage minor capsid protein n=1 Tax=Nocardioides sp. YR527 TaxID=1881028 RepID=UPI0015A038A5|nr:phage minor capsid protein [Nocardioides sp. YR527]